MQAIGFHSDDCSGNISLPCLKKPGTEISFLIIQYM